MQRFSKIFFLTSIPFGIFMGLVFAFNSHWRLAVVSGLMAGILFGLIMAAFSTSQWVKDSSRPQILTNEQIVKDGPANHFKGLEGVGGWLFLTDRRLVFKSHSLNVQTHELSIPLNEISDAQPTLTAKFIPNGLKVITRDGHSESFVVEGRREWSNQIKTMLAKNNH